MKGGGRVERGEMGNMKEVGGEGKGKKEEKTDDDKKKEKKKENEEGQKMRGITMG